MKTRQLPQPKIELGKCPFCEKQVLIVENNTPKRLEGYSEFWVSLSDGSRMKVAVCTDCKKHLTKKNAENVVSAHRVFWEKGIRKTMDDKISQLEKEKQSQVKFYNSLTLVKFGQKERDLE